MYLSFSTHKGIEKIFLFRLTVYLVAVNSALHRDNVPPCGLKLPGSAHRIIPVGKLLHKGSDLLLVHTEISLRIKNKIAGLVKLDKLACGTGIYGHLFLTHLINDSAVLPFRNLIPEL